MPSANDLKLSMCTSLTQMGDNHYQLGQIDKALDYYKQALSIARESAEPALQRRILVSLALSSLRQANFSQTVDYYEQAMKAAPQPPASELSTISGEAQLLLDMGKEFYRQGDIDKAASYAEDALRYAKEMREAGDRAAERLEHMARAYLGIIICGLGDIEQTNKHCSAAMSYAQSMSDDHILAVAQIGLGLYQILTGRYKESNTALNNALAKAGLAHEPLLEAEARTYLCFSMAEAGQPDTALEMLAALPDVNDAATPRRVRCVALAAAGLAKALANGIEEGLATCQEAITLAQDVLAHGDRVGARMEGAALNGLGSAYLAAGQPAEAMSAHRHALARAATSDDSILHIHALLGMGEVSLYSNSQEARMTFDQARELAQELGREPLMALALAGLGQSSYLLGDPKNGLDFFEHAYAIAENTDDHDAKYRIAFRSGDTHRMAGERDIAVDNYEQALRTARAAKNKRLEAQALGGLGLCLVDTGDPGKAIEAIKHLSEAENLALSMGNRRMAQVYVGSLASAYAISGQTSKAVDQYRLALANAREAGDRAAEGVWMGNLANLYAYLDQPARAVETYQKAIEISQEVGEEGTQGRLLVNLALVYSDLDRIGEAVTALKTAMTLFTGIGDSEMIAQTEDYLAQLGAK